MAMPITKKSYEDLKPYWDYQRKVEYNREVVHFMAEKFEGRIYNETGMIHLNEIKDTLWTKVKSSEYEEPKKGYIPKDPKFRFEWEGEAYLPTKLLNIEEDDD